MNLFDIMGPVMVGPSSSHTAGAVRIGRMARRLLGEGTPKEAAITLYGSFAATGQGHGTDRALVAGLLGMQTDDERIASSYEWAEKEGMNFSFSRAKGSGEHPNTARIDLISKSGKTLSMTAASLGGGRITVTGLDGLRVNFSGDLPTLIVQNEDKPGHVSAVSTMIAQTNVNVATMQLYRDYPGGNAVMIVETDKTIPKESLELLRQRKGIQHVTFIDSSEN